MADLNLKILSISFILFTFSTKSSLAGDQVFAEGLNYTNRTACSNWQQLTFTSNNASAFYLQLLQNNSPWTTGHLYLDSQVWDSDFVDPQLNANGDDTHNFDQVGYGLSYFTGHGSSGDFTSPQYNCSSHSNCTNPAPNQTGPGKCLWDPNIAFGTCFYKAEHLIGACGSNPKFNNAPNSVSGIMAFGESANSGSWAFAGTNGGVNVAIIDNSNTIRTPAFVLQSLGPMFAGVHMIGAVMPIGWGSDNIDNQEVGPTFGMRLRLHPTASVREQWLLSMGDVSSSQGTPCGNWGIGGGHGIGGGGNYGGGCGARIVASLAQTCSFAQSTVTSQNTYGAQNDNNDPTGSSCISYIYMCNYDCATYPFDKGLTT